MRPRLPAWVPEALLYAALSFAPLAFGAVETWSKAALESLCYALALASFLRGRPANLPSAADWLWLFPAALAAYGAAQAQWPVPADGPIPARPYTMDAHATDAGVRLWAGYAALLWAAPRALCGHEAVRRFCRFAAGLGALLAVAGFVQAALGDRLYGVRPAGGAIPFGPYYNRDHAANLLMLCLGPAVALVASKAGDYPAVAGPGPAHLRAQVRRAALAGLILLGLAYCGARGALLALPLAGAALLFFGAAFRRRLASRSAWRAGAAGLTAFALFLAYRYVVANADAGARLDSAVAVRFMLYADAWRMWTHAPAFGSGLGAFASFFPPFQDLGLRRLVTHVHSDWLELALEAGLPGVVGAALFVFAAAHLGASAWREGRSREMKALAAGLLFSLLAFVLHSFFDFSLQIPANAAFFFTVAGAVAAAPGWMQKTRPRERPEPPPLQLALGAAAACLLLVLGAARPAVAAWYGGMHGLRDERRDALARAWAMDPAPRYLRDAALNEYRAAGGAAAPDAERLRAALRLALAAAELRPFDSDAAYLAGFSLQRLGRGDDATSFVERADLQRFSPRRRRSRAELTGGRR